MRSIETKLRNLLKTSLLFSFAFLLLGGVISIKSIHAQDIPNTEEIKAVIPAASKKRAVSPAKTKEAKPKPVVVALKNNAPQSVKPALIKTKVKNAPKETNQETYAVIPVSENDSKLTAPVNGTVRLKQLNQGAAGVLIEAIRADTREMIDSAETNAAGEYRLNKLPTGITLIFLVSSEKTKPLIFQTAIADRAKNLDFSVLPK